MKDEDPQKMNQIRKFSAIYGRFDCKRRPDKPLTLHEVCCVDKNTESVQCFEGCKIHLFF